MISSISFLYSKKISATYQAAEKCETNEVFKQKNTTCDETEDNDEDDEPSTTCTKFKFIKKVQNTKPNLDFNALVQSCLNVTPPDPEFKQPSPEKCYSTSTSENYTGLDENLSEIAFENCFPDAISTSPIMITQPIAKSEDLTRCSEESQWYQDDSTSVAQSSKVNKLLNQLQVVQLEEDFESQLKTDKCNNMSKNIEKIKDTLLFLAEGQSKIEKNVEKLMDVFYRPITDGANGSNLFPFPIKSIDDLKKFDKKLGDDDHFLNQIVSEYFVKTFIILHIFFRQNFILPSL